MLLFSSQNMVDNMFVDCDKMKKENTSSFFVLIDESWWSFYADNNDNACECDSLRKRQIKWKS